GRIEHDGVRRLQRAPGLVLDATVDLERAFRPIGRIRQTRHLFDAEHRFALDVAAQPERAGRAADLWRKHPGERALAGAGEPANAHEPRRRIAKKAGRAIEVVSRQRARSRAALTLEPV